MILESIGSQLGKTSVRNWEGTWFITESVKAQRSRAYSKCNLLCALFFVLNITYTKKRAEKKRA